MNDNDYKRELLKLFNEQFAQNQNNLQNLFIQVVSILITVIVAFGIALALFGSSASDRSYQIGLLEFTIAYLTSQGILLLGISLISSLALGFRRDQLVNASIREAAQLTTDTATKPQWSIFPASYNPAKSYDRKRNKRTGFLKNYFLWMRWMPNFHTIFLITLFLFQVFLLTAYLAKLCSLNLLFNGQSLDWIPFLFACIGSSAIVFSILLVTFFHKKILTYYDRQ